MISTRIVCRPFVGRADELEHLLVRRRQAGDGHGGLVLIGGEPGIGKSRLVREFELRLNRHTSAIAASACREFAQKPLGPMFEVLEQIAHVGAGDLARSSKAELLDSIATTFERVADRRTTVVVLEDLHWADIDLMQTLLVLVRRAGNKRLLFVGTYGDNELVPTHPLFKWFGQLFREQAASAIALSRFGERELDRLMTLAIEGSAQLSPPMLHAVRDRSDGNPLFAEELLRSAVDSKRAGLSSPPRSLPLSLHALVAERLHECTKEQRALLRHASLLGRDFAVAHLCDIFGGSAGEMQPFLERSCDLQLLDAVDAARGVYRFRHALTRDVIYGEMPPETVQPLHLRIAEHLERSGDADEAPEV
ncbi:MAG: AAA family ATPase, partial [Candidatus Eremiobacteraeota bacterium]|nr:AAA family ATPase [Candidatus Eremiobacteraeota bacterium]